MSRLQAGAGPAKVSPAVLRFTHVIAPALMLLVPFVSYVRFHDYGLWRPEILLCIAAIVAVGVVMGGLAELRPETLHPVVIMLSLILFFDLQSSFELKYDFIFWFLEPLSESRLTYLVGGMTLRIAAIFLVVVPVIIFISVLRQNAGLIITVIFGVSLLATILLPTATPLLGAKIDNQSALPASDLPPIVHLILDEHIGIEGIPTEIPGGEELRNELIAFYQSYGFTLYTRAFTNYPVTDPSITGILNGKLDLQSNANFEVIGDKGRLLKNAWFRQLANRGYRIRVYQSTNLDFCRADNRAIDYCFVYPANSINSLIDTDLSLGNKARISLLSFIETSLLYKFIRESFKLYHRSGLGLSDESVLGDIWNIPLLGAISSLPIFDRLTTDLRAASTGTVFFAHLMTPHFSYVYDRDCRLRNDITAWFNRVVPVKLLTSSRVREQGYRRYFDQVRCVYRKLDMLLGEMKKSGILEKATVIIHGDHGTRLSIVLPEKTSTKRISNRNRVDNTSVLLAIKAPKLEAIIDRQFQSIQSLFAEFAFDKPLPKEDQDTFFPDNP